MGAIFRPDFCPALDIQASETDVIDAVLQQNFVPIVDDRGCLCGIVTRRYVILYLACLTTCAERAWASSSMSASLLFTSA